MDLALKAGDFILLLIIYVKIYFVTDSGSDANLKEVILAVTLDTRDVLTRSSIENLWIFYCFKRIMVHFSYTSF